MYDAACSRVGSRVGQEMVINIENALNGFVIRHSGPNPDFIEPTPDIAYNSMLHDRFRNRVYVATDADAALSIIGSILKA